jgi:hypothetical protein
MSETLESNCGSLYAKFLAPSCLPFHSSFTHLQGFSESKMRDSPREAAWLIQCIVSRKLK